MQPNEKRILNLAVQVLPLVNDPFPVVDRAIAAIAATGLRYEVGPMETVIEGTLDEVLAAGKAAHLACFDGGATRVVTIFKLGDSLEGTTIEDKVAKYRSR